MKKTRRSFAPLFMLVAVLMSMTMLFPAVVSATSNTMTVVSDTDTMVTDGNVPESIYPYNTVLAWVHPAWSSVNHVFSNNAEWIWESERVLHTVAGDIVEFKKEFYIPGSPTAATMYITCDNGYELRINGTLIGTAQLVDTGWRTSDLTESFVNSSGWQSVETWNITSAVLVPGLNNIEISAANEQMDGGTTDSNPAGLIFEIEISYDEGIPPPPPSIEVGGFVYPINTIAILTPWIVLAAVIVIGVAVVVRRRLSQS